MYDVIHRRACLGYRQQQSDDEEANPLVKEGYPQSMHFALAEHRVRVAESLDADIAGGFVFV